MSNHRPPSTTDRSLRCRLAGVAAATACVAALALPGVASAATADDPTDLHPRLERACLRIPNLEIRTGNLLERLQADAETVGSLAWLEGQIERAQGRGREQLVTVLENRLKVRTAAVDVLQLRADALVELAARCAELGVDL